MNRGFTKETIERVARIYKSNQDAGVALGITMRSFGRLCRKFGIETPYSKRRRLVSECRQVAIPISVCEDADCALSGPGSQAVPGPLCTRSAAPSETSPSRPDPEEV